MNVQAAHVTLMHFVQILMVLSYVYVIQVIQAQHFCVLVRFLFLSSHTPSKFLNISFFCTAELIRTYQELVLKNVVQNLGSDDTLK